MYKKQKNNRVIALKPSSGFTIIEVIVVIVIIAILATLIVVSYNGVQASGRDISVQSDLDRMDTIQTDYHLKNNVAGKTYNSASGYDAALGFTPSSGNVIDVVASAISKTDYCIRGYNPNGTKNSINNPFIKETTPGICDQLGISTKAMNCPSGFIAVPGSSTYGTSEFCVMKYEAKNAGGNVPISQASGTSWFFVTQTNAINFSNNVSGCTGCHLITEAEWLTIAQNVLSVPSNWSTGTVGSGYIYSGHNDAQPGGFGLAADTNDNNGYFGETNTGGNQRRTLTLTNSEVIWDLAGNMWEWTSGQATGGQPGVLGGGWGWREWTDVADPWGISPNPFPLATGISGASAWNSSNGIGKIYSSADDTSLHGFIRGGNVYDHESAGVLELNMFMSPSSTVESFRVAR